MEDTREVIDIIEEEGAGEESVLQQALKEGEEDAEGAAQILALADTFSALSRAGPAERRACLQILTAFAEYARSRPRLGG